MHGVLFPLEVNKKIDYASRVLTGSLLTEFIFIITSFRDVGIEVLSKAKKTYATTVTAG